MLIANGLPDWSLTEMPGSALTIASIRFGALSWSKLEAPAVCTFDGILSRAISLPAKGVTATRSGAGAGSAAGAGAGGCVGARVSVGAGFGLRLATILRFGAAGLCLGGVM